MVLIQVLVPIVGSTKAPEGDPRLIKTADELGEAFGGLTAYMRSPAKGLWTSPAGRTEEDEVVMVEVVTDRFDQTWWKRYAAVLAERFGQDVIHVRALPIELLDLAAS